MKNIKIKKILATLLLTMQCSTMFMSPVMAETKTEITATANKEITKSENTSEVNIDKFNSSLSAESYVVMDSKTGEVIMGKNEDKVMYPASLTKIVTSLLLLESNKLNDKFVVSKEADSIGEASIYAAEGEELSGLDLLYAMMLQSANDACYVVGEGVSPTIEDFYALMTNRAKELGAVNSNFSSANGLHEEDHVTTAVDLALITKEALKFDEFRTAIKEKTYSLTRTSEGGMKNITNKNRMLFPKKSEYNEFSIGGKTAYTRQAGNCLMEVAEKDGMEIIVITLKSDDIYPDTNKIINFAFDNFKTTTIMEKDNIVYDHKGNIMDLYADDSVGYVSGLDSSAPTTRVEIVPTNSIVKKVVKGEKFGVANVYVNEKLFKSVPVYSNLDYDFSAQVSFGFIKNLAIFSSILIAIKLLIKFIKYRKEKTKGYLKNSNLY